ncbi:MAG: hypothetical protein ABL983_16285, partial [Nitrospira sp.]
MVSSTIQANLDSARGDSLHLMGHRRPMTWKEITINSRWNEWIVNCLKNRLNGACMSHSCRMMKHRTRTFPFNLVPVMTVAENVDYPLFIAGVAPAERKERVAAQLAAVGLQEHAHHR